jgi:hypothetical protein
MEIILESYSIILEGDSSAMVSALREKGSCSRAYGQLVDDIKTYLVNFLSMKIEYVRRDTNKAAHVLVKCAIYQLLDKIWDRRVPLLYLKYCINISRYYCLSNNNIDFL